MALLDGFSVSDLFALLVFAFAWGGYTWVSARALERGGNTSARMKVWRERWMRTVLTREENA